MERETKKSLNIEQIQQIIPHRHPFCLIDRIEDYEPGEFAIGYKAVTYTEEFFKAAHNFPSNLLRARSEDKKVVRSISKM